MGFFFAYSSSCFYVILLLNYFSAKLANSKIK